MLVQSIFDELKKIILGMEIKYKYLGEKRDTAETKYRADRFINAMEKVDNFFSYPTIDMDAIMESGLTKDEVKAAEYSLSPTTIPEQWRDKIVEAQRRIIIERYDEGNDYFRRIYGLPEEGQTSVYLDLDIYEQYGIDFKPLHEFTDVEVMIIESIGTLDQIRNMYPELKYLNYLGERRISPYNARKAANFQVLRVEYEGDFDLLDRFLTIYEQCREYTMRILYVNEFSSNDNHYDSFMALMTAVMAVQRVLTNIYQGVISRDFFDVHLVQALFESYGVPFIESLPLDYQKLLAKNLDKLLHYKSTDKVIYDIVEILGYGGAEIFKYFLVKEHQFDDNGKPIYDYVIDENGEKVPNHAVMYDVYFQTVNLKERNEEFALTKAENRRDYNEVVSDDPYWWSDDADLLKRLYETEFTYIETKYLHMNIMFKVTEMIFELVHVFRILQDKREQSKYLTISIPRILPTRKVSLFTFTMFMCAAIAKRNNLTGEIITSPSKTLYLMGFDFEKDLIRIREALNENSEHVDHQTITSYIKNMDMYSHRDVNNMFNNIRSLWEFLSLKLKQARTIEEYRAYNHIYRALMVTQDMEKIFTKSDGQIATTYLDMLRDIDPDLATVIDDAKPEDLFTYLNHGIDSLQTIIKDTKYLYALTDTSQVMLEALRKLILFFKSYTVDLKEFNIIYVLDHPYLHGIKIISQLMEIESEIDLNSQYIHDMMLEYLHIASEMKKEDKLNIIRELITIEKNLALRDALIALTKLSMEIEADINTKISLLDVILIESSMTKDDLIQFIRETVAMDATLEHNVTIHLLNKLLIESNLDINTKYTVIDTLLMDSAISPNDTISMNDNLYSTKSEIEHNMIIFKQFKEIIESNASINDKIMSIHTLHSNSVVSINSHIHMSDAMQSVMKLMYYTQTILRELQYSLESETDVNSKIGMISTLIGQSELSNKNKILFTETLNTVQIQMADLIQKLSLRDTYLTESVIENSSKIITIDTMNTDSELLNTIENVFTETLNTIQIQMGDLLQKINIHITDATESEIENTSKVTMIDITDSVSETSNTDEVLLTETIYDSQSYVDNVDQKIHMEYSVLSDSEINTISKLPSINMIETSVEGGTVRDVIKMREQIFVIRE